MDRVKPLIDLREQVVSFKGQPVITEDNLVVSIDTVLFFQVTDPRAADYEIVNYIQAIEQITATMLRSVIGNMDLEETLTSRDKINTMLRGVLDDASGKWGLRVTRVEIKAIDPPRASSTRWRSRCGPSGRSAPPSSPQKDCASPRFSPRKARSRARSCAPRARSRARSCVPRARRRRSARCFRRCTSTTLTPRCSPTSTCETLPQLAQAEGNTFWVIPSEVTTALKTLSGAFGGEGAGQPAGPQAGPGQPGRVTGAATAALAVGGTGQPGADGDPAESPALTGDPAAPGDPATNGDLTRAEQAVAEQAARTREELAHVEEEVAAVQAEAQRFSPS